MLFRKKLLRLLLGLSLGLTFFGCVGFPRRRQLAEVNPPDLPDRPPRPQSAAHSTPAESGTRTVSADTTPPAPVTRETTPPAQPLRAPSPPPGAALTPPPPATQPPKPSNSLASLRQLYTEASKRYATMDGYIARLTRREFVKGKYQPEEVLLFKFRKKPFSVYLKWAGPLHKGREVLYVKGHYENKLHTLLAAGDMPLMGAGKRISLALDSPFLRGASRHPITEAGIGSLLAHFGAVLDAQEKGDTSKGTLTYLGKQQRPDLSGPLDAVEWKVPPGADPSLPRGGRRSCFIHGLTHLPALLITRDERGKEVEYYRYDRYQFGVPLDDDDFNPEKVWGCPGGGSPKR